MGGHGGVSELCQNIQIGKNVFRAGGWAGSWWVVNFDKESSFQGRCQLGDQCQQHAERGPIKNKESGHL